jgi:hypothetical protein
MATNTYVALDKKTISGSTTNQVSFTSIPSTYTDLFFVVSGSLVTAANDLIVFFNNENSGTNYSATYLTGNGTTATSSKYSNRQNIPLSYVSGISDTQGSYFVNVQNYSNSTTYKTMLGRVSNSVYGIEQSVGLWRSTSVINQVDFLVGGTTRYFAAGTTISLYGIRAEGTSPAPKATGGAIYSDSTYYYHVFGATGTFTPLQSLTADYLVIAGGGGGGGRAADNTSGGGGGGAGGLRSTVGATGGGGSLETALSLSATAYTVTVGGGGAGGSSGRGTNGIDSTLSSVTSTGGGAGGGQTNTIGNTGGSGGGSAYANTSAANGTTNQGYAGGANNGSNGCGGGGGGAGQAGQINPSAAGGYGGAGVLITGFATATGTGVSSYYAGGGGGGAYASSGQIGGAGGAGGGGTGATGVGGIGTAGTIYTGSGGGGSSETRTGGNGGSGVVIVRYAKV